KVIMIGDRKHDIIGAKTVGVDAIGVIYGYGSYDELEKAGADYIVGSVSELEALLLEQL
ncbi:MAG: HAD hydrolase-like protein, partial [Vallitaleaceae bacterium]|nr:HAD hydrolase-like protein [Vallitaleaceae bacterium]